MKKRCFSFILYLENLRPDWQDALTSVVQLPCCYAIHDAPEDLQGKKPHVHLMISWSGPVTDNFALDFVNSSLSAPDLKCCSTLQAVNNPFYMYQYLVHASSDAVKKGKYRYPDTVRISLNGFSVESPELDVASFDFAVSLILDNDLHDFRKLFFLLRELRASGEAFADPSVLRENAYFFSQLLR